MFLPRPFLRYLRWWSAGLAQWCSCVWFGKPTRCIQLNASWRDWRVRRVLKRGCNPRPGHTSSEIAEVRTKAQPQTTWLSENLRNMESGGIRQIFWNPDRVFPQPKLCWVQLRVYPPWLWTDKVVKFQIQLGMRSLKPWSLLHRAIFKRPFETAKLSPV